MTRSLRLAIPAILLLLFSADQGTRAGEDCYTRPSWSERGKVVWGGNLHEPLAFYRRENRPMAGVDANALWLEEWYHRVRSPKVLKDLAATGANLIYANFAKGAGGNELFDVDLACPWQNAVRKGDVNNNGEVTAGDALIIINELAQRLFSDRDTDVLDDPLTVPDWPGFYFDQTCDNKATALDALRVINELAVINNQGGGEEEFAALLFARNVSFPNVETRTVVDEVVPLSAESNNDILIGSNWRVPTVADAVIESQYDWQADLAPEPEESE